MTEHAFNGAKFPESTPVRAYRTLLWRIWDTSKARIGWIMLNPSTTEEDPSTDDATIRRVTGFTKSWGYGGFDVCNLYDYRSRDPDKLFEIGVPVSDFNDEEIFKMHGRNDMTIAAWGSHKAAKLRQPKIRHLLEQTGHPLHVLGLTRDKCPKHPLYVKSDTKPVVWNHTNTRDKP